MFLPLSGKTRESFFFLLTNYHIHLIFSERLLLEMPDNKIATRAVYFDETGKRVRTKKEITGEDGAIRRGCTVIPKGEIYEHHMFTTKDTFFKSKGFLAEVKELLPPKPKPGIDMAVFREMKELLHRLRKCASEI